MGLLTLFDSSVCQARKPTNQTDFEERYKDVLSVFPDIVEAAFKSLNTEIYPIIDPASRDRNMMSVMISGMMRGHLIKKFPDYCVSFINDEGSRFKLRKENFEWLYIKKLDDNKLPSNIGTDNSVKIMKQLSDSEKDIQSNVFLGYIANEDKSAAKHIYAVYIVDKKVQWFTDLREFAERNKSISQLKSIISPVQQKLKEGTIKIKKAENQ